MSEVMKQGTLGAKVKMGTLSHRPGTAWVRVTDGNTKREALINLSVEEFLAGVAEAYDVTVIEGSTAQPKPYYEDDDQGRPRLKIDGQVTAYSQDPEVHRGLVKKHTALAAKHAALLNYLEAHPPVDKEALGALSTALLEEASEMTVFVQGVDLLARRLYDRGVRLVSE